MNVVVDAVARNHIARYTMPFGYPGGPCHVVNRIEEQVRSPGTQKLLSDRVDNTGQLNKSDERRVYRDPVVVRTKRNHTIIVPHALYRMDLRGITQIEVMKALKNFNTSNTVMKKRWQQNPRQELRWTDPSGLVIGFTGAGGKDLKVITVFNENEPDPSPPHGECAIIPDTYVPDEAWQQMENRSHPAILL